MSEIPPNVFWHAEAESEFEEQHARGGEALRSLAGELAAADHNRPEHLLDIVEQMHVRRAGDLLIEAARELGVAAARGTGAPIFISYSTRDQRFVDELQEDLRRQGVASFVANRSIRTAADWAESILQAVRGCRVMVLVVTAGALRSNWCKYEIGAALGLKKPVVSVLRHVAASSLPDVLQRFQALEVQTREEQSRLVQLLQEMASW